MVLMKIIAVLFLSISSLVTVSMVNAETVSKQQLKEKLSTIFGGSERGIQASHIKLLDSEVKGFYIMQFANQYGLVSKDGKHYLSGDVWNIDEVKNLTEALRQEYNLSQLNHLEGVKPISFKAKNPKSSIWVFTDIDCFYCRKLHNEMAEINNLGITVNYFSFPRSGNQTAIDWKKAQQVWCSKDRQGAMTASKQGKDITDTPKMAGCNPQIEEQYEVARQLGIRGTPAIILANGQMVSGYLPASQLALEAIANTP